MTQTTTTTKRSTARAASAKKSAVEQAQDVAQEAREQAGEAFDSASSKVSKAASEARAAAEDGYREAATQAKAARDHVAEGIEDGYRHAKAGAASAAREVSHQTGRLGSEVGRFVNDHPLMVGAIGFAGGLLIGALLPRSRREDRFFGGLRNGGSESADRWNAVGDDAQTRHIHRDEDIERRSDGPYGHGGGTGRVAR